MPSKNQEPSKNIKELAREGFENLKKNLNLFFKKCLKIKLKKGGIVPLNMNPTQRKVFEEIEKARREKGVAKIVIVKARQMGVSTLISGWAFWKAFFSIGFNAFTMADSTHSTSNIFGMIKRFYDCLPKEMPQPSLKKSNEKLIHFKDNDSMIRVGTAGAKQTGRSMTNNFLHCSEVAFWKNEADVIAGIFQTVPEDKNSTIILESTANGRRGLFFHKAKAGLDPDSDWTTIFIPWYFYEEYSTPTKENESFVLTEEEREIKAIYKLTDEQLNWRRRKIKSDFEFREDLFKQEYPISFAEAFLTTSNALIPSIFIEKARKSTIKSLYAPVVMGVDPARGGKGADRNVIVIRQGRKILKVIILRYKKDDNVCLDMAGRLTHLINDYKVERCFIDVACGYGIIDILKGKGFADIVQGVPFNLGADNPERYTNKRTEIFGRLRDWFLQQGGASIPDNEEVATDFSIILDFTINANGQWVMLSKKLIKKENDGKSYDIADATALTFTDQSIEFKLSNVSENSNNLNSKLVRVKNINRMGRR